MSLPPMDRKDQSPGAELIGRAIEDAAARLHPRPVSLRFWRGWRHRKRIQADAGKPPNPGGQKPPRSASDARAGGEGAVVEAKRCAQALLAALIANTG